MSLTMEATLKNQPKTKLKCAVCLHIVKSQQVLWPALCNTCFRACKALDVNEPQDWLVAGAEISRRTSEAKLKVANEALTESLQRNFAQAIKVYNTSITLTQLHKYCTALEESCPIEVLAEARATAGLKPMTRKETAKELRKRLKFKELPVDSRRANFDADTEEE
jgi:hypothetical protein